jgi:hypothetical protein
MYASKPAAAGLQGTEEEAVFQQATPYRLTPPWKVSYCKGWSALLPRVRQLFWPAHNQPKCSRPTLLVGMVRGQTLQAARKQTHGRHVSGRRAARKRAHGKHLSWRSRPGGPGGADGPAEKQHQGGASHLNMWMQAALLPIAAFHAASSQHSMLPHRSIPCCPIAAFHAAPSQHSMPSAQQALAGGTLNMLCYAALGCLGLHCRSLLLSGDLVAWQLQELPAKHAS